MDEPAGLFGVVDSSRGPISSAKSLPQGCGTSNGEEQDQATPVRATELAEDRCAKRNRERKIAQPIRQSGTGGSIGSLMHATRSLP